MNHNLFKTHHYLPKLFGIFLEVLRTPLFVYFTIMGNMVMFLSAWLFFILEREINSTVSSYWDGLWWALCTISTVGYGDIVPMTAGGRLISFFLIIVGVMCFLGSMAVLVSVLTAFIEEEKEKEKQKHFSK